MKTLASAAVIILLMLTVAVLAQQSGATAKVVTDHTDFDFGYIPSGSVVSHSYILRNGGGDSLKILSVKPACGCTKAPLKKEVVAPGDSAPVELVYTSGKGSTGGFSKSATVTSNDSTQANLRLNFSGKTYASPDSLQPVKLSMGEIEFDNQTKSKEMKLTVTNVSTAAVNLHLVSSAAEYLDLDVPNSDIAPGKTKEIKVKIDSSVHEDQFQKSFTLELSDQAKTRITVPVSLNKTAVAAH